MYAGAAIGVSHLVQATRAGADYGFSLIWAVVVVHLFKYPFFEFAHRYTASTGESLLAGYLRSGRWALYVYMLVALALSIPSIAVLTLVTSGMAAQLFPVELDTITWAYLVLASCLIIIAGGGYMLLEKTMKILMVVLAVCTLIAVVAAFRHGRVSAATPAVAPGVWNVAGITFLVALMGWMPTPLDAAVFPSVWMEERARRRTQRPNVREALFDFHVGYFGSLITAIMFLCLGALVMFGSGETLAGGADAFAAQFVGMYTTAMGDWSRPIIIAVAFITMFSTTLAVLDAYPRVLMAGWRLARPEHRSSGQTPYWTVMAATVLAALLILTFLTTRMRTLIDFATSLAFLSAPLFAYLNCRVIRTARLPAGDAPPQWLIVLSWAGLAFVTGFSILYLVVRFGYNG